jgi:hypothetical protein
VDLFSGIELGSDSDNANGETKPNDTATFEYMKKTFTDHYNGNRQPIGLYTHPIHLSVRLCLHAFYVRA